MVTYKAASPVTRFTATAKLSSDLYQEIEKGSLDKNTLYSRELQVPAVSRF
jgi:hypothetical protein